MPSFEDRLWGELAERHGTLLARTPARPLAPARPQRSNRRAPLAAVALALCVALIAVVLSLTPNGGQPAYAVTRNPNGTVTVTIRELVGVTGADRTLRALNIPARIVGVDPTCQRTGGRLVRPTGSVRPFESLTPGKTEIDPAGIPAGDTLVLAVREVRHGVVALKGALYRNPPPQCIPTAPLESSFDPK